MPDNPSRRRFVGRVAGLLGGAAVAPAVIGSRVAARPATEPQDGCDLPAPIAALRPMLDGVTPIAAAERRSRIERARRLMAEQRIDALLIEPGTTYPCSLRIIDIAFIIAYHLKIKIK